MKPYTVEIIDEFCQGIAQSLINLGTPLITDPYYKVISRLRILSNSLARLDTGAKQCLVFMLNGLKPSENIDQLRFVNLDECRDSCIRVANAIGKSSYLILHQIIDNKIPWSINTDLNLLSLPHNMCAPKLDIPIDNAQPPDLASYFHSLFPLQNYTFERIDKYFKILFLLYPVHPSIDSNIRLDYGKNLYSPWYHPERNAFGNYFYWSEEEKVEGFGGRNYYTTVYCAPEYPSTEWCAWVLLDSIFEDEPTQIRYTQLMAVLKERTPLIEDIFKSTLLHLKITNNDAAILQKLRIPSVIELKRRLLGF